MYSSLDQLTIELISQLNSKSLQFDDENIQRIIDQLRKRISILKRKSIQDMEEYDFPYDDITHC